MARSPRMNTIRWASSLVSNTSPWVSKRRWAKSAWVKKARVSPSPLTAPVLGRGVVAIAARRELTF